MAIGASAGGLEAFEQFFQHMPDDSGMAFVLIPHLSPDHKSFLQELLSRHSRMSFTQVKDGQSVQPNSVYIIPPDRDLTILGGTLRLLDTVEPRGVRHPIDFFFRALAQDQGRNAIGIVLSGTGTEGTLGLKAIKGEDGLVIVQEPKSAKFDGMPVSAVATGLADYVLPPERMPECLLAYTKSPVQRLTRSVDQAAAEPQGELAKIFAIIRSQTGHDFSLYKHSTVIRRIARRMAVLQIENHADYVSFLRRNPSEINVLFKELLIRVTHFFRDPEAYEALRDKALPIIFSGRSLDRPVRIWIPGCSTGEEAYSLAILFHEFAQRLEEKVKFQIFATDIDDGSIGIARAGIYPSSISVDVSPGRLFQYFTKKNAAYRIKEEIRETVVFAEHDINKDPPFSRMDLISCRNLLIYLGADLQKRLLPLFRSALNPEGILFLGSSETIGDTTDLFAVEDKKWRIFKARKSGIVPVALLGVRYPKGGEPGGQTPAKTGLTGQPGLSIAEVTEKLLVARHAPSCAMVDREGVILYLHGRPAKYLEPAVGKATLNILDMAREGLRADLRYALRKSSLEKADTVMDGIQVGGHADPGMVNLCVHYLKKPEQLEGFMLVEFQEIPTINPARARKSAVRVDRTESKRIEQLEFDLKSTKERLQSTIEEIETSNEELQSSNEELQSANEELQSTNEELETSKEELQSTNEELITVNSELQNRMEELIQVNNDMSNLLASTKIASLFLDGDLRIKRFTPDFLGIINLVQADLGRPLSDFARKIDYADLERDAQAVLASLSMKEVLVQHDNGAWFLARIIPYRTAKNVIEGVVATFVEITEQKRLQELQDALDFSKGIVDTVREPLLILDAELRVTSANKAFYDMFKTAPTETEQRRIYDLGDRQWNIPGLRTALEDILPSDSRLHDFVVEQEFPEIGPKRMLLNASRIQRRGAATQTVLLAIVDISEQSTKDADK